MTKILLWFTNNLRVIDHPALYNACKVSNNIEVVYCINPQGLTKNEKGIQKIGLFRAKFLVESLLDLQRSLAKLHIPFHILVGQPQERIPTFINKNKYELLYLQKVWHQEETKQNKVVLERINYPIQKVFTYDQFLINPDKLPFSIAQWPKVFTAYRKKVEGKVIIQSPLPVPHALPYNPNKTYTLTDPGWEKIVEQTTAIPIDSRTAFPFKGGTTAALKRIDTYFWNTNRVSTYKETRNELIGQNYSTKLSAWLANGSISARTIYSILKTYEAQQIKNESTYWVFFELLWRDFFKGIGLKHTNHLFKSGGILNKKFLNGQDAQLFKQWKNGTTKDSFINANMKELALTGWMSNRGRQNVASYWSKTLGQDWRMGAQYFQEQLIDYDVDSNWGNWMYASGVGNDPRNRTFNSQKQAHMYDKDGAFQSLWNKTSEI